MEPFHKVIFALGIRHVGETTSKSLAKHFKTIDALMNVDSSDLSDISDIGDEIAISVTSFFNNEKNLEIINKLKKFALNMEYNDELEISNNRFENLSFVVTGSLEKFTRNQIKALVIENGGKFVSSISKSTSYLVVGKSPGSKLKKALSLGVKVISENDFDELLISE